VDLYLKETDTIWMLDLPGTWVDKESEEAAEVIEKNTKYNEVSSLSVCSIRVMWIHAV